MPYDEALAVACQLAIQHEASQVIAESTQGGFVVGPARGWDPPESLFVPRAKVKDGTLAVTYLGGWSPESLPLQRSEEPKRRGGSLFDLA